MSPARFANLSSAQSIATYYYDIAQENSTGCRKGRKIDRNVKELGKGKRCAYIAYIGTVITGPGSIEGCIYTKFSFNVSVIRKPDYRRIPICLGQ